MRDDKFEWDDRKAVANRARHGIGFETARKVFKGPYAVDEPMIATTTAKNASP